MLKAIIAKRKKIKDTIIKYKSKEPNSLKLLGFIKLIYGT